MVIEGAPELDGLLPLAGDADLVPPVAGLVYAVDAPRRAAFYPLAAFSPEWVAMRWAVHGRVPVRFADLPAVHSLAEGADDGPPARPSDAIGVLARAAGYDDAERWWEDAVEHRRSSSLARFADIREAMAQVRAGDGFGDRDPENLRREASMRKVLRAALREGFERVAVVCGAYHAPVLHPDTFPPVSHDNRLLTKPAAHQGGRHLGALDRRPARGRERLRRRRHRTRLVPAPVRLVGRAGRPRAARPRRRRGEPG
ncbi:hypothetical protein GCM10025868_14920 [Angustibacter aerolatus]|uniref:Uncharacterized protein n=1 Tax=Angustibacter aerolatus TaxID=1162965 RepID=A0ABQ6JEN4_9ACTN|nr:DUF5682 family protein [Angustibacter aerolatus]GMA86242.1 hypothetical protein GCM10025868_14920 [Angustibacter aerolatus]